MKGAITPYLTFYGEGKEAAEFYTNLLGLEQVKMQKYSDADFPHPPEAADYLLHCHLRKGDFQIMLADSADKPSENKKHGVTLLIDCESEEEAHRLYDGLREEGYSADGTARYVLGCEVWESERQVWFYVGFELCERKLSLSWESRVVGIVLDLTW